MEVRRAFDPRDPDEREMFEAAGAHVDKCTNVVAQVARWAVEIIGQEMMGEETRRLLKEQGYLSAGLHLVGEE